MKKVCVITGGGSGMGLATAKLVCEEGYYTILVGRTASKLEKAVNDLRSAGGEAEAFSCDVSDRESCFALAKHAAECGEVKAVLHIAGLSPHMGDAEKILRGNALGTGKLTFALIVFSATALISALGILIYRRICKRSEARQKEEQA